MIFSWCNKQREGTAQNLISFAQPKINNGFAPPAAAGGTSAREKITEELPTLVPKIGSRIFSALTKQTQKNLEQLRGDIANPSRIPERITKQTADLATEAN